MLVLSYQPSVCLTNGCRHCMESLPKPSGLQWVCALYTHLIAFTLNWSRVRFWSELQSPSPHLLSLYIWLQSIDTLFCFPPKTCVCLCLHCTTCWGKTSKCWCKPMVRSNTDATSSVDLVLVMPSQCFIHPHPSIHTSKDPWRSESSRGPLMLWSLSLLLICPRWQPQ